MPQNWAQEKIALIQWIVMYLKKRKGSNHIDTIKSKQKITNIK